MDYRATQNRVYIVILTIIFAVWFVAVAKRLRHLEATQGDSEGIDHCTVHATCACPEVHECAPTELE